MLNKLLSSIGIGSATIDTRIHAEAFHPGEEITGEIHVRGGSTPQEIRGIYLRVMTDYVVENDDHKYRQDIVLGEFRIPEAFTLQPQEERVFDFTMQLPFTTPVTHQSQTVWVRTGLDIAAALDSSDRDLVQVRPTPTMKRVLEGMELLGFRLQHANCEKGRGAGVPFVQEFEFRPVQGAYRGRLDEVDVVFRGMPGGVEVLLEVDRKARGLGSFLEEAFDMDERYVRIHFDEADVGRGAQAFAERLEQAVAPHV